MIAVKIYFIYDSIQALLAKVQLTTKRLSGRSQTLAELLFLFFGALRFLRCTVQKSTSFCFSM